MTKNNEQESAEVSLIITMRFSYIFNSSSQYNYYLLSLLLLHISFFLVRGQSGDYISVSHKKSTYTKISSCNGCDSKGSFIPPNKKYY